MLWFKLVKWLAGRIGYELLPNGTALELQALTRLAAEDARIRIRAEKTVALAEQLVEENKRLNAEHERLRGDAATVEIKKLVCENERLRQELSDVRRCHDALLEEMEGLLHG